MPINFEVTSNSNLVIEKDSIQDRQLRIARQSDIETQENKLYGLSVKERLVGVRQHIFGRVDYRKSEALMGTTMCSPPDTITGNFDKFCEIIDNLNHQITPVDGQPADPEKVLDFIAAYYTIGMLIHPFEDGNGQTFKTVMTSYVHELLPDTKDLFIPYKVGPHDTSKPGSTVSSCVSMPVITGEDGSLLRKYGETSMRLAINGKIEELVEQDHLCQQIVQEQGLDYYTKANNDLEQRKTQLFLDSFFSGFSEPSTTLTVSGQEINSSTQARKLFDRSVAKFKSEMSKDDTYETNEDHQKRLHQFVGLALSGGNTEDSSKDLPGKSRPD